MAEEEQGTTLDRLITYFMGDNTQYLESLRESSEATENWQQEIEGGVSDVKPELEDVEDGFEEVGESAVAFGAKAGVGFAVAQGAIQVLQTALAFLRDSWEETVKAVEDGNSILEGDHLAAMHGAIRASQDFQSQLTILRQTLAAELAPGLDSINTALTETIRILRSDGGSVGASAGGFLGWVGKLIEGLNEATVLLKAVERSRFGDKAVEDFFGGIEASRVTDQQRQFQLERERLEALAQEGVQGALGSMQSAIDKLSLNPGDFAVAELRRELGLAAIGLTEEQEKQIRLQAEQLEQVREEVRLRELVASNQMKQAEQIERDREKAAEQVRRELESVGRDLERRNQQLANEARQLLEGTLDPFEQAAQEIEAINNLVKQGALTEEEGGAVINQLFDDLADKLETTVPASGGGAVEAGTVEARSLTEFSRSQANSEQHLRELVANSNKQLPTLDDILERLTTLVERPPEEVTTVSIPN